LRRGLSKLRIAKFATHFDRTSAPPSCEANRASQCDSPLAF
jgi:hypothetical protein